MPGREHVCVHVSSVYVCQHVCMYLCVCWPQSSVSWGLGEGRRQEPSAEETCSLGTGGQEQGALLMGDSPDSSVGQRVGDGRRWAHLDLSTALFSL